MIVFLNTHRSVATVRLLIAELVVLVWFVGTGRSLGARREWAPSGALIAIAWLGFFGGYGFARGASGHVTPDHLTVGIVWGISAFAWIGLFFYFRRPRVRALFTAEGRARAGIPPPRKYRVASHVGGSVDRWDGVCPTGTVRVGDREIEFRFPSSLFRASTMKIPFDSITAVELISWKDLNARDYVKPSGGRFRLGLLYLGGRRSRPSCVVIHWRDESGSSVRDVIHLGPDRAGDLHRLLLDEAGLESEGREQHRESKADDRGQG